MKKQLVLIGLCLVSFGSQILARVLVNGTDDTVKLYISWPGGPADYYTSDEPVLRPGASINQYFDQLSINGQKIKIMRVYEKENRESAKKPNKAAIWIIKQMPSGKYTIDFQWEDKIKADISSRGRQQDSRPWSTGRASGDYAAELE